MIKKNETKSFDDYTKSINENLDRVAKIQAEAAEEAKIRQAEREKWRVEFDKDMKKLQEFWGDFSNNIGHITEQYFYNSFEKGKTDFFGEKFDEIQKNVKGFGYGHNDEYDILLINGVSIGIIEVKHKAHQNDIPKILNKVKTFRVNFPKYKDHKVYLGYASYGFYPEVEAECKKYGIAIIQQAGDTMIMNEDSIIPY